MKIYEALKDVLSSEQLDQFKKEVQNTIKKAVKKETDYLNEKADEYVALAVKKKTNELSRKAKIWEAKKTRFLEKKAEEYVGLVTEEKTNWLEKKADEYVSMVTENKTNLLEKKAEEYVNLQIESFDRMLQKLEHTTVEALDRFLESEISSRISDNLLESVAQQQALRPIVDGMKELFEKHYVALDTDGAKVVEKLQEEKNKLQDRLSDVIAEKMELSELAEAAAIELLIREKTDDLSVGNAKKVKMFFEGKSYDEVAKRIDGYINLMNEDTTYRRAAAPRRKFKVQQRAQSKKLVTESKSNDIGGFDEKKLINKPKASEEDSFLSAAQLFMG